MYSSNIALTLKQLSQQGEMRHEKLTVRSHELDGYHKQQITIRFPTPHSSNLHNHFLAKRTYQPAKVMLTTVKIEKKTSTQTATAAPSRVHTA